HGIQSGPLFISQNPDVAYGIYAAYILAHPCMLLICVVLMPLMMRVTSVRMAVLAPLVLGLILGDQIEINLVRAIMTDANPWLFLTRPISGGLLLVAVGSIALAIWQHLRHQKRMIEEEEPDF